MSSTKCRHQHHGAATALDEPAAERMGQFKMGGGVQGETAMQVCRADMVLAYLVKQAGMSLLSRASQVSSTAETRLPSG